VVTQLNVIPLLANMAVLLNKAEAVDLIMPLFVESLEEGDASVPSLVRLRVGISSSFLLWIICVWT
jgi:phosphatidylinositol 4-kinase